MPRKTKTETIVTENMEPKEEQVQMPDTPEPAESVSKEVALETEENTEKPENTDDMDGVPATENPDAGAGEENNADSDITSAADGTLPLKRRNPPLLPKQLPLSRQKKTFSGRHRPGTARHSLRLPEGRHPLPSSP